MLHFVAKNHHIGDVHPYYVGDKLYLMYLVPNGLLRCDACFTNPEDVVTKAGAVAITRDYINWQEQSLPFIIVNVVKVGDSYYTCRSCEGEHSLLASKDLLHWEYTNEYRFSLDKEQYPAGARDFGLFFDDDLNCLRLVALCYQTNEHNGLGSGMDCAIMLSDALTADGVTPQRSLIAFPNHDTDLWNAKEPEVSQMMKIGNRWYLLTSLARQSNHWVGAPSYWIGEENTPIDQQDWSSKKEHRLDGEDLCAAQFAQCGSKVYLYGWIPINCRGQEWGGALNLPREVYALEDGTLATRLDEAYAKLIRKKEQVYLCGGSKWMGDVEAEAEGFGLVGTVKNACRFGMEIANGLWVEVMENGVSVVRIGEDGERERFAGIDASLERAAHTLHVIFEQDLVEVFLDDRLGLCAKVDAFAGAGQVKMECDPRGEIVEFYSYELQGHRVIV